MIGRRRFISLLGGAAAAWPLAANAQQPAMPVIGYLDPASPEVRANRLAGFRKGLSETGYVEGQNLAIEFRWAHNEPDRLPALAADLVRRKVAVIAAPGSISGALAAKGATATIPIVFSTALDPVRTGLVAGLNRPGGNATGVGTMNIELDAKRLGLLHELVPAAARLAVLFNPNNRAAESVITGARAAAAAIGREIEVLATGNNREIDAAFAGLAQKRVGALLVSADPLFANRRVQLILLVTQHRLPAIYYSREFAEAGGLMSYGANQIDVYRQVGIYAGRILKGDKPADLPVLRPTTFEFVINLQTAKLLGIEVPSTLLARADEVIE